MAISARQTNAVIPPGLFIEEESEARGMNRRELADALKLSVSEVSELIAGNIPLTPAIAAELERTLEMPSYLWIRLESKYRRRLAQDYKPSISTGSISSAIPKPSMRE